MKIIQIQHQNADAEMPLIAPVMVLPNTPEVVGNAQIERNGRLDLPWLDESPAHDGVAVICGGGPSIRDQTKEIARLTARGATLFGLNGASKWLRRLNWPADVQIIVDAKQETSTLVDFGARRRLYASQVHPDTADAATELFHLANIGIEDLLPPERVAEGGYTLVGGGVSVGITALCVAYTMGYRVFHLFGYDSSNSGPETHAYSQQMNQHIPTCLVPWGGKTYVASMPMKIQAEAFIRFGQTLIDEGCDVTVHGTGLLPAMWNSGPVTEREKYQYLWSRADYRKQAPGEKAVDKFLELAQPGGSLVIDYGCGTGRAALEMENRGVSVLCIDFTDNCRDLDAIALPFVEWDLTEPLPVGSGYGYCTDVMEHIPTEDVGKVIRNIMEASARVFFQIATIPDNFGAAIGQPLHLTVKPHEWWAEQFADYRIEWQERTQFHSSFYVSRSDNA